jgi:hypothetical protein
MGVMIQLIIELPELNKQKQDRIRREGQTAGTPLFDGGEDAPTYVTQKGNDIRDEAYNSHPHLGNNELIVYAVIRNHGPITDRAIADRLKWPINCITGRRRTLVQKGRIERYGTTKDPVTGKSNIQWRIKEPL